MAIAYLQHGFIGKATQASQYTAVAHAKYILRRSACHKVLYQHVPKAYRNLLGWIKTFEDGLRKNGRVVDKLVLAVHRELTLEQAELLVARFKWAVTQGRTPFLAAFQDFGSDNPHAHVMLFDRDVETGKRVFQTTEKGSTERLKAIWQDESNAMLAELGIDARIQFGPKQEEAVAISEMETTTPITLPADAVEEPLQEPEAPDYVDEPSEESAVIVREGPQLLRGSLSDLLDASRERTMILTAIERRNEAWQAYRDAEDAFNAALGNLAAQTAAQTSARNAEQMAQMRVEATHRDGKPKGFRLSLFGFEWKSSRYKLAEAAQAEHAARYEDYQRASVAAYNASGDFENASQETLRRREEALRLTDHVKVYGNDDEVLEALATMQQTIRSVAEQIDFEELKGMFDAGEITREEYLEAVSLMGEALEVEQEQGEGQSY